MVKGLLLFVAFACCICGMGWFALSLESHWRQLREDALTPILSRRLRVLGWLAIIGSLAICLAADHASMAALVWVMNLAASALIIAFTLAWRPPLLRPLLAWTSKAE